MRLVLMLAAFALTGACRPSNVALSGPAVPDSARLAADVSVLASDAFEGRGTGTPGNDSAAAFIARRFEALKLEPLRMTVVGGAAMNGPEPMIGAVPGQKAGHLQRFIARSVAAVHAGLPAELPTQNVVALIPGRDSSLRNQYVVLGAHFDHLGRSTFGAQDPDAADAIRNGADDNASGTAAIMELARLLKRNPTRRPVAIVAFSGEELGLLGSQWFVDHAPFPIDSVQAMLNFDMVGRLRDDKLLVYGVGTAAELPEILTRNNVAPAFKLSAIGDGFGPSDHSSFYGKNIPVLHFFTDVHDQYHKATDDAPLINAGGMARVTAYAERITREIADRPSRLTFVRQSAPTVASARASSQAYLGSVPDMGGTDIKGLRLSGVRPGSPADSGGLKQGDVIVAIGETPVTDLYTYTDALYSHQPGDVIDITVLRGTERLTMKVKLGRRGG